MDAIIGLAIEIGKCFFGPVKCQFNYLCCFNNNIQILRDEAQNLKDANERLQMRVNRAENDGQVIYPQIRTWLERVSESKDIISGIENDVPKVQKGCLKLILRYSVSRKAKKTAEALRQLRNDCKFDQISQDAPPAAMESLPLGPKEKLETRKKIEEGVMEALRNQNINMIGLCGMGGIGKTTMVDKIMDRVREEKLFDEAMKVVVSQQVKIIQQSIADQLNLTLDVQDLAARAYKICKRLTTDTKRILIVFEDVWDSLKLQDLGIPSGNITSRKCTVLLTSRDRSVLEIMETQIIFLIKILPKREAWLLFRENTGNCVDNEDLCSLAENVVKECKGLPVALVTVGRALKNKECREVWEDALVQLRSSNPAHLPYVLASVYNPLKLSYDYLEDKDVRSLFLLCNSFGEDVNINLEILTWYGMGLNMFEGLNLTEARNRTCALIEVLKDRSLLLDGSDIYCVKMHAVGRDTSIYISPEEGYGGFEIDLDQRLREYYFEDCFWISMTNLSNKSKFPVELKYPSLRLLTMKSTNEQLYDDEMRLTDSFFDGMQEIRVLSMAEIHIRSLPSTIKLLKNLKTLYLFNCRVLESIGIVGELLKLEILCCIDCCNIRALPREIGGLKHLKLLEIIRCRNLKRMVPSVISNLINLEELKIKCSFNGWEAKENNARENAALVELESLTKLTCLELEINNVSLVAEEIRLPFHIVKCGISLIMKERDSYFFMQEQDSLWDLCRFKMCLEIPRLMNVGNWIKTLVRCTEFLDLKGDGATQALVELTSKLKSLTLRSCSLVKKLLNMTTSNFPVLESFTLAYLDNLVEIFPPKPHKFSCFENLRTISIEDCPRLRYLFPMSAATRFLTQLQDLTVIDCEAVEDIIIFSDDDDKMEKDGGISRHNLQIALPKLSCLKLAGLPRLILDQETLSKILAPHDLKMLHLERLMDDAISSIWCLFSSFRNLEQIEIFYFNGIKNLMSPTIAGNLVHLKTLGIHSCKTMSEVIAYDYEEEEEEEQVQVMGQISLFPHLEELDLVFLPKLKSFSQQNHRNITLELPSLRDVTIDDCPQMETFTLGPLSTPKLERIQMDLKTIKMIDLNKGVQQNFRRWESTSKLRSQKREKLDGIISKENTKEEK